MARTLRNKRKFRNKKTLRTLRTLRKKRKLRTIRNKKTLRKRGGSYEKDAAVTELDGEPVKGLHRMVVASSDGFVGSGKDFLNHKDYEGTQISTVGGFRSVFKR